MDINGNRAEAEELHHQPDPNRVMKHIDLLQKDNHTSHVCSYSDPSLADGYKATRAGPPSYTTDSIAQIPQPTNINRSKGCCCFPWGGN
ncbi:hypothetical protein V2J09_014394 [Rumex salicifolius]